MKYLLTVVSALVLFTACKKVETPNSREQELREGRWKHSAMTMKYDPFIGKDTTYNLFDSLPVWPPCKKDNFIMFGSGLDARQYRGDLKCNESEPESVPFHWNLDNDKNTLNLWSVDNTFFGKAIISAPFKQYSTERFVIEYVDLVPSPINNTKKDTLTYTHTFVKF